ncbi:MAG: ABC transporter ATP-binding protein [Acidobacteria bacterium]|nr:ABC transporter ATP-binding protein [Acidobacteriota bacterium]
MRRLITYLRPHVGAVVFAFLAILVGSLAELAQPWLTQQAIDRYIAARDLDGLWRLAMLFLGVLLVAFVVDYAQTYVLQTVGQQIMRRMRMQIYARLQALDLGFYDRNPVGRLMTRVTTDVDALNDLFTSGVITVFGDVLVLSGIMVAMLLMNWQLALVAFAVLPAIVWTAMWFRRNVRSSYREVRGLIARVNAFLQEHLTGMATVQLFGQQARTFRRFDAINGAHRDANVAAIFYYAVFYPAIELLAAVSGGLIIWIGGGWALDGGVSLGVIVAFLQYSRRFFQPISDLSEKFNIMQAAMAASERIFTVLDTAPAIVTPERPVRHRLEGPGRIEFEHVWFAYKPDQFVLEDVSFTIEPGQRIGVVGATGSGKTTLVSLLLRFYDVTRGRILVDGVDVRDWDLTALRGVFGVVLQDPYLFSGTIADNIRLGHAEIGDDEVVRAAEAVHANGFIERRSGGYGSLVAERGATLSLGQKQLLSFARAIAFDPKVLLLDEATASIDTATEALIEDALRVMMRGRTVLAIAHRLSTVQHVDRILVLHDGELRESGSHQELLAARGLYYKLFQLQYAGLEQRAGHA